MKLTLSYGPEGQSRGLKELQHRQKAMLSIILDLAERHGIDCVMVAGSALGAARHSDMIPWDDDIDVGMMRSDLRKFEAIWLQDPPQGLTLHSPRTESSYPLDYIKIRQTGTAMDEEKLDSSGMRNGIFVDLFAFDLLPASTLVRKMQRLVLSALNLVIMSYSPGTTRASGSMVVRWLRKASLRIRPILPWRQLIGLREYLSTIGQSQIGDGEIISFEMYGLGKAGKTIIERNAVFPAAHLPFGDRIVPVPQECDNYLTKLFGDWRQFPPEDQRAPIHAKSITVPDLLDSLPE